MFVYLVVKRDGVDEVDRVERVNFDRFYIKGEIFFWYRKFN